MMMGKLIIIQTLPACEPNIHAVKTIPKLLQNAIDKLKAFNADNGLPDEPIASPSPLELILKIQQAVPDRERLRGQDWIASRISDTLKLQDDTKVRLHDLHKGKIGGLHVTLEKFKENIEVPTESARALVDAVADLDNELLKLPKDQFFSQFVSINSNGKVIVAVDAEEKIRDHFTTYANQAQEKFYNDVSTLLHKLSEIENKFNVQGLTAKAIGQNDGEYFFQCQHLTFVKHG